MMKIHNQRKTPVFMGYLNNGQGRKLLPGKSFDLALGELQAPGVLQSLKLDISRGNVKVTDACDTSKTLLGAVKAQSLAVSDKVRATAAKVSATAPAVKKATEAAAPAPEVEPNVEPLPEAAPSGEQIIEEPATEPEAPAAEVAPEVEAPVEEAPAPEVEAPAAKEAPKAAPKKKAAPKRKRTTARKASSK